MEHRHEAIAILKRSLDFLWTTTKRDNRVANVCAAIELAARDMQAPFYNESPFYGASTSMELRTWREAEHDLVDLISERLGDKIFVSEWLSLVLGETIKDYTAYHSNPVNQKLLRYRRAWVRDMIRTLENGGDL